MKTILAAVDLAPRALRVCDAACALARRIGARLVLLHVVPPLPVELRGPGFARRQVRFMLRELDRRAQRRLESAVRRCRARRCRVEALQLNGPPAALILDTAVAQGAGLIVLGSHGHGAAYDFFVGSTAQEVLRRAPCPVVVVPMTDRAKNAARGRT
jgi:nucleotide-binding universal stress UspA family protein